MPTANRPRWVPRAIRYFQRQDYPNRELVILDDGEEDVRDLIPADPRIHYKRLSARRTLGAKQNLCVAESRGDLIIHWDDDDWFASNRITSQVDSLLRSGSEICGLAALLFHDLQNGRTWLYEYPGQFWLAGGSLLYTKDLWSRHPFPDRQLGADTTFVWSHPSLSAAVCANFEIYVAMIHGSNTSPKIVESNWTPWSGDLRNILGDDLDSYAAEKDASRPALPSPPPRPRSCPDVPGLVDIVLQDGSGELLRSIEAVRAQTYGAIRLVAAGATCPEGDRCGEFLFVLDPRCVLHPEAIQTLVQTLAARPDAAYAYGGFLSRSRDDAGCRPGTMTLIRRSALPQFDLPLEQLPGWHAWIIRVCEERIGAWSGAVLFELGGLDDVTFH